MNPTPHPERPLAVQEPSVAHETPMTNSLTILEAALKAGVTSENVAVVQSIIAMRREEVALENKAAFNKAFFELKKEISTMDFYADKTILVEGKPITTYCSEEEISKKLEPVLFKNGFTMLFGQRQEDNRVIAIITLVHESGHEETREYSVRVGDTNRVKDATKTDTGSTTSAWRHLVIKMFGLKSRIREDGDARNIGGKISAEKATELRARCDAAGGNTTRRVLAFAMTESFEDIGEAVVPLVENLIVGFEKAAREKKPDTSLAKEELFK